MLVLRILNLLGAREENLAERSEEVRKKYHEGIFSRAIIGACPKGEGQDDPSES